MPHYTEYLNRNLGPRELTAERQRQLARISKLRGRDVLVYAASMKPLQGPLGPVTSISYDDLLPIDDQLSGLTGTGLDLIIESPGGSGEVAEDIVRLIRQKYGGFAVIVPGWAKSAATIIAMAANEILMAACRPLDPSMPSCNGRERYSRRTLFLRAWRRSSASLGYRHPQSCLYPHAADHFARRVAERGKRSQLRAKACSRVAG